MQRMIINLLTYYWENKSLFDEWVLPTQVTQKQDLIDRLLMEIGELELYITNPQLLSHMIGSWSRGRIKEWQRVADIWDLEYNPIWNVDGDVVHTETTTGSQSNNDSRNRSVNESSNTAEAWDENEENETINTLSADNSSGWQNDTKTNFSGNKDGSKNGTASGTTTETEGSSGDMSHETSNTWHDRRTGNIGVTTTQKMLTEEKEFWENFDLYGYLIKEFSKEFCLLIY